MESEITPYKEVNLIVTNIRDGVINIFDKDLVGIYLTGSLSYGDFDPKRSDIDVQVVLAQPCGEDKYPLIEKLHEKIESEYPFWLKRIEVSYTPIQFLKEIMPPKLPRPYYNEGVFYPEAPYGNEWIINQYQLVKHGITIYGLDFKELVKPIDIVEVQKACIRDLLTEWKIKTENIDDLKDSHMQSYVVLNICRILYTVFATDVGTKKESSKWIKETFAPKWTSLITEAEVWEYGKVMNRIQETIDFVKFGVESVKKTDIYKKGL